MSSITDPLKDILLAGIGALAIGGEKAESVINQLVEKGQLTVEQGKDIASNLGEKASAQTSAIRDDIITAQMRVMSKEQREALAERVAELAASLNEEQELENEEVEEVKSATGEASSEGEGADKEESQD
jgi:polyhydroxyalkanoate synthesis regulator phasin